MKLIALHTVHHDKVTAHAGEPFDVTDKKDAERLVALGAARPALADTEKAKPEAAKQEDKA